MFHLRIKSTTKADKSANKFGEKRGQKTQAIVNTHETLNLENGFLTHDLLPRTVIEPALVDENYRR